MKMQPRLIIKPVRIGNAELAHKRQASKIQQANPENQAATTPTTLLETPSPVAEISNDNADKPARDNGVNRMPLYLLILICLVVYLYWARETGQLPIDQWLKILG